MLNRCLCLLLLMTLPLHAAPKETDSAKKGWGGSLETCQELKANWYYNWSPTGKSAEGVEFVPMVKGKHHVTAKILAEIKASGAKVLLGFNEPERDSQGSTTVAEALQLWPQLEATGLRLGSPAPSSDAKGMAWLDAFMEGVKKQKLRVDFIALHWYRSANSGEFDAWLDEIYKKYRRPIWITEFNAYYSGGDKDKFAEQAFKAAERNNRVERFAYFTCPEGKPGSLWTKTGGTRTLTALGKVYQEK